MSEMKSDGEAAAAGPLFYTKPEVLDVKVHAKLGLTANPSYAFAAGANATPVTAPEFAIAARFYPIVVTGGDNPAPIAVLGLRKGENAFVDAEGRWAEAAYVPAYVRRYPFAFVEAPDRERLILCVDTASDLVSDQPGQPFFDAAGAPTETTNRALEFCKSFQEQHMLTRRLVETLTAHDLLRAQRANIELGGGQKLSIGDFKVVDEERLNGLDDEAFLELRKAGALPFIYCMLLSQTAWRNLAARASKVSA